MKTFTDKTTSVILLCLLVLSGVKAQESYESVQSLNELQGSVVDSETGMPLPYVNILVLSGDTMGYETDVYGFFTISNPPKTGFRLEASYLGYHGFLSDELSIHDTKEGVFRIKLSPSFIKADQVIITATRKSQTLVSAPVSVDVVNRVELEAQNATTFDEAFDGVTGVNVTRSSKSNVQALSIRGASEVAGGGVGNRVLLLIDGRPALSPDSGGALWNLVPVNSIEKIEIVKGAYSSLFGSSAMGGVVNVITKEPKYHYSSRLKMRYGFYGDSPSYTGYDDFSDFNSIDFSHSNRYKKNSYLVEFSRISDDGHREKSALTQYNFYGKYQLKISNLKSLKISGNINKINSDTPATWISRTKAYSVAEHRKDDYQEKEEYNADIYYSAIRTQNLKYSSRVYYYRNNSAFSFNDDPDNDTTNVNFGLQVIDNSSIMAERVGNVTQLDFTHSDKHYMIGGIEGSYDRIIGLPDTVLYGRQKAYNVGIYFQDEYYINSKFTATAGVRYDYFGIVENFMESNVSPKISFVYNPNKKLSFRTLFGQAFRNPSIAERFIKFEQGGGLKFIPNPDLKSEKLKISFELGSRYQFATRGLIDFAFFYNQYNNLISFQQIANPQGQLIYQVVNLNKSVMQGFETSISFEIIKNWNVRVAYTYLDAQDTSPERLNDKLAYKRKHNVHFMSSYEYKNLSLHFNARYKSRIEEVFIYPGSEPEAYFLMNCKLDYKFNDRYKVFATIDNIGDIQYEELERYRLPGRSFSFGLTMDIHSEN